MNATPPVRLTLDKVVVRVIRVPLRRPIVARLGEFKQLPFILTDVHTKQGVIGHSYLAPYRATATKSIVALIEDMAEQQRGKPVAPFDRFEEGMRSLHLLGRQGVMLIAIAALDMAMWDALAKALGLPLVVLLGGTLGPVRAYNTNGLWLIPVERIADEASSLIAEADFRALKIRLGRDSVKDDLKAIAEVRRAVGDDIILMSDFNQGLSFNAAKRRLHQLDDQGLEWFEEPIVFDDFVGLCAACEGAENPVADWRKHLWPPALPAGGRSGRSGLLHARLGTDRRRHGLAAIRGDRRRRGATHVDASLSGIFCPSDARDGNRGLAGMGGLG